MATIKSFTDISQSKTLSKILPLESADYFWAIDSNIVITEPYITKTDSENLVPACKAIPCWSLAVLLSVLPDCPDLSKHTDNKWYITTYPNDVHICLMAFDNPIDACYEMILKLHELKIL